MCGWPHRRSTHGGSSRTYPASDCSTRPAGSTSAKGQKVRRRAHGGGRPVRAQARMAAETGATLLGETVVGSILPTGASGVEVGTTSGDTFRAPVVVVTAGPWAAPLLRTAGIDLPLVPSFEQVTYCRLTGEPVPHDRRLDRRVDARTRERRRRLVERALRAARPRATGLDRVDATTHGGSRLRRLTLRGDDRPSTRSRRVLRAAPRIAARRASGAVVCPSPARPGGIPPRPCDRAR
jgi:glycine/D-amino acid oxidase-like deaminating enzyme